MDVRLLGPLEVVADDGEMVTPAGLKERTLLAMLALDPGRAVSTDRLIDALWGEEPPAKPANALQARVSALRRSLGRDRIVSAPAGYVLDLDAGSIDVHRHACAVDAARKAGSRDALGQALIHYDTARSEWRGDPLADFTYHDFAQAEIASLEELRLATIEERIEVLLDLGRATETVSELEEFSARYPLRERLWQLLMIALYRSGRQADALRAFGRARHVLAEELGIDPSPESSALEERILLQDPELMGPAALSSGAPHNLPARVTPFLGRSSELEELEGLILEHRLVTLVGPGGVGKTSLALAVAGRMVGVFTGGVWLAELASLSDPDLLADHVARSLGLRPMVTHGMTDGPDPIDQVRDHLRGRETLLVLDNCEHLVGGAAQLADVLLREVPGLSVLATSREPLRITGEVAWQTPPLTSPSGEIAPDDLVGFDSIALFLERARAARPGFELDSTTAPAVSMICSRLDGLPLAIELAAARVRTIPVRELAARIHDRLGLLTDGSRSALPRQRTLRAAIEWSHDLLGDTDRIVFRRLSVFAGGWTIEAAERVCSDSSCPPELVLATLTRLVDRSLITVIDEERYGMLETIREFALERLEESREIDGARARHVDFYVDLVERAELRSPEQTAWVRRFDREVDNLRHATSVAVEMGDHRSALRLVAGLGWYWFYDRMMEGRDQIESVLAVVPEEDTAERAAALRARAMVIFDIAMDERARAAARESVRIFDALGLARDAAESRCLVALDAWFGQEPDEARRLLDEAARCFVQADDVWGQAFAEFVSLLVAAKHDDLATAVAHGERSIELFAETGDPWALTAVPAHLAEVLRWTGDIDRAIEEQERALASSADTGLVHVRLYCLNELGQLTAMKGDQEASRQWFEAGLALAEELRYGFWLGAFGLTFGDAVADADPARAAELYARAESELRRVSMSPAGPLAGRAELALRRGELDIADEMFRQGVDSAERYADRSNLLRCLAGSARVALRRDDADAAAAIATRIEQICRSTGLASPLTDDLAHLACVEPDRSSDRGSGESRIGATST